MRSCSGPAMRFWYLVTMPGEQVQGLMGSPKKLQGQACGAVQRRVGKGGDMKSD